MARVNHEQVVRAYRALVRRASEAGEKVRPETLKEVERWIRHMARWEPKVMRAVAKGEFGNLYYWIEKGNYAFGACGCLVGTVALELVRQKNSVTVVKDARNPSFLAADGETPLDAEGVTCQLSPKLGKKMRGWTEDVGLWVMHLGEWDRANSGDQGECGPEVNGTEDRTKAFLRSFILLALSQEKARKVKKARK